MSKDYNVYINNELNRLTNYANYLLDFNKKFNEDSYGLTRSTLRSRTNINKYEKDFKSAYEKTMSLYDNLKTIGEKYKTAVDIDADIKDFRKKLHDANLPIFEGSEEKVEEIKDILGYNEEKNTDNQPNWIMPCIGPIVGHYGEPRSTHTHDGIDIAVPVGTPIKAVSDGDVYYVGANDPKGYGKYIIINHHVNNNIVTSEYGHLSSWYVVYKQQVKQGQIIGSSGNTGHSNGPHCHLTIREGVYKGTAVDPYKYIKH